MRTGNRFLQISAIGLIVALVPGRLPAAEADFHVSPGGDDAHAGTAEQPFATLSRAREAVRQRIDAGLQGDVTVLIHGGTYRIDEPLVFGPGDSGTEEHAIVYAAAPGEDVRISGGREITGWTVQEDGTWSATLPDVRNGQWSFRELFADGERRPRARHPNEGYFRVVQAGPDKRTSFTFEPEDLQDVDNVAGAELVFLHDWSTSRVEVARVDREKQMLEVADPIGPAASHYRIDHFESHPRYYLEGARAFLDKPGEWFLDTETGVVSYRPLPGESPETSPFIAPVAGRLLVVRGEADRPVKNLHFRGLTFEHCAWRLPGNGYAAGQAAFHERRDGTNGGTLREPVPAAVLFEDTEGCRLEGCRLVHLGGSALRFGRRCRNNALTGTVIRDVAGNGVMIGEDRSRRVDGRPWWQAAPEQAAAGNRLANNRIERCGQVFFGSVGVWVGMAHHTRIVHNLIRRLPYTGVSLGWMWNPTPTPCHHNRVANNHIHDVMQILSDGGGIYTLGRQPGTVLAKNHIHSVPRNAGRAESNGMFLDQGTTEILIEGNVIERIDRSPLRFHQAGENLVRGNHLVLAPGVPPVRYNATDPKVITLQDNTIVPKKDFDPSRAAELLPDVGPEPSARERLSGGH